MQFFIQGLSLGLAYAAPIGLQNMFVITAALTSKRRRAFMTAMIVVFFDVTLALACFFGAGAIIEKFQWLRTIILIVGSLVVLYIGISLLKSKSTDLKSSAETMSIRKTISSACIVTWFNPQALIDGTMMLGAFHASLLPSESIPFIIGVSTASCIWFNGLTLIISVFSNKFSVRIIRVINIVCGCIIVFYGAKLFITGVTSIL